MWTDPGQSMGTPRPIPVARRGLVHEAVESARTHDLIVSVDVRRDALAERNDPVSSRPRWFMRHSISVGQSGRGERLCAATNDLPITMRLAEPPEPFELVRSA
jgi:hypothetical protein